MQLDPLTFASLLITGGCLLGAFILAMMSLFVPSAAASPFLPPLFKLLMFVFSIGAGAVLFKALG